MQTEREITRQEDKVLCDRCKTELAATEVTDAVETATGWTQSMPRRGCLQHPVVPMVRYLSGREISFAQLLFEQNGWSTTEINRGFLC